METNLDRSLKKIEYIFNWTGMLLDSAKKTAVQKRSCIFLYFLNVICINSEVLGAISWFINGARKGESLIFLTYVTPCITITILCNIKTICFLIYHNHVSELFASLRHLELKYAKDLRGEKKHIVTQGVQSLHKNLRLLNVFNCSVMIIFPLMTLILILTKYIKTHNLELFLPLLVEYPFDEFNIKIWPFVYAKQVWSIIAVVLEVCGTDYVFYISSTYICIQFRLLSHEIVNLCPKYTHADDDVHRKIKQLVLWHLQIKDLVRLLEIIYSKSTLFNFLSSSALICLTGFNVTAIDDVAFVVSFLSFLFMSLLQIFFLCYYGDMLMRSSSEVSDSVYNSRWYNCDAKVSKKLFFILKTSQKPVKVTAFGFADVNYKSFTKILSTSWSYFALLRTVYNSNY